MRDYGLDNETEVALGYMTLEVNLLAGSFAFLT